MTKKVESLHPDRKEAIQKLFESIVENDLDDIDVLFVAFSYKDDPNQVTNYAVGSFDKHKIRGMVEDALGTLMKKFDEEYDII